MAVFGGDRCGDWWCRIGQRTEDACHRSKGKVTIWRNRMETCGFFLSKKCERSQHASFQGGSERFLLVDWSVGNRVVRSKININKNRQAFMRKAKIVDTIGPGYRVPGRHHQPCRSRYGRCSSEPLPRHSGRPPQGLQQPPRRRQGHRGRNVAALVDLQGPKIRCGWFKKNADGEDKVQLTEGQEFVITTGRHRGRRAYHFHHVQGPAGRLPCWRSDSHR